MDVAKAQKDGKKLIEVDFEKPKTTAIGKLTAEDFATLIIQDHGNEIRICEKGVLHWEINRWVLSPKNISSTIQCLVHKFAIDSEIKLTDKYKRETANFLTTHPAIQMKYSKFDEKLDYIPLKNGAWDIKTRKLESYNPAKHFHLDVMEVDYDELTDSENFSNYMKSILPDSFTRKWMQLYLGYSLLEGTESEKVVILKGTGTNGKSVLLRCLSEVMGNYCQTSDLEILQSKGNQSKARLLAPLEGIRLALFDELPVNLKISETALKMIASGGSIKIDPKNIKPYNIRLRTKMIISTNYTPSISGSTDALKRRLRIVHFDQKFNGKRRILGLAEKLLENKSGIIKWILEGTEAYLNDPYLMEYIPDEMVSALNEFYDENTYFNKFINYMWDNPININIDGIIGYREIKDLWVRYCEDEEIELRYSITTNNIIKHLKALGCTQAPQTANDKMLQLIKIDDLVVESEFETPEWFEGEDIE